MSKRTYYLIIGLGIVSILTGVYSAIRTGDLSASIFGVVIGLSLIGTVVMERQRKDKAE